MSGQDVGFDPGWRFDADRSGDGISVYRLATWLQFSVFLNHKIFTAANHHREFVWRGQRRSDWSLSTSFDRLFDRLKPYPTNPEELAGKHLDNFRYAIRGRRGTNPAPLSDDSVWAIGQHYGLATPLLDWTRSPYAAAYFAFESSEPDDTEYRTVVGLNQNLVTDANSRLESGAAALEFIDPLIDENPRLVSQGGLFTRAPIGTPVERWVQQVFEGAESTVLYRIEIPNNERMNCLRGLHQMNINHVSLFPDLLGASVASNLKLEFDL